MATLIELAEQIETDYAGDIAGSVKVCRPQMSQILSESNLPYLHIVDGDSSATGIVQGSLSVKSQTGTSDFTILTVSCLADFDSSNYSLSADGKKTLTDYKQGFRPIDSEYDNLWPNVVDHFQTVRNLINLKRLNVIAPGTPVYGQVTGLHLIGDGLEDTRSATEYWAFEATYPWGTPGNILSWKY